MSLLTYSANFWTILFCLLNFGLNIFIILSNHSSKTTQKIHDLELDVATLKANQSNAIKHDDLAAVYKRLEELSQSVNKLIGKLDQPKKAWWQS
jgi:hypothetical protein